MEIWKDIKGYEGLYQVSSLGNVRSLDTMINCKGAKNIDKHLRKGKVLKKYIGTSGYYTINLSKNSKIKVYRVHRLIANAFIPNINNLPLINHKDGNKLNNNINNLEWCTYAYNNKEAYRIGLKVGAEKGKYGKYSKFSKPLLQYSVNGELIKEWENAEQVKRELGYCPENIRNVCNGRRKIANGYIWKYKEVKT